jgi:ribonuclease R
MLLANETVAADLSQRGIPTLFRVHGKPDAGKIAELSVVAEAFGKPLDASEEITPGMLADLLRSIAGTPLEQPLGYLALRAMQQATYGVKNLGHFALAARDYLHFTSPIRRYPDLVVHRTMRRLLHHEKIDAEKLARDLVPIAVAASRAERRAMTIERECVAIHRAILMKDRVGDVVEGRISGVTEAMVFVYVDAPFVEVKIPVERLTSDRYELDRLGVRLVGVTTKRTFALGDPISVRIEEVSVERREIVGLPASQPAEPAGRGAKSRSSSELRTDTKSRTDSRSRTDTKSRSDAKARPETKRPSRVTPPRGRKVRPRER